MDILKQIKSLRNGTLAKPKRRYLSSFVLDIRKYNSPRLAGPLLITICLNLYLGPIGLAQSLDPRDQMTDDSSLSGESMAAYVLKQLNDREQAAYARYEKALARGCPLGQTEFTIHRGWLRKAH